jgi:hypothetical protein
MVVQFCRNPPRNRADDLVRIHNVEFAQPNPAISTSHKSADAPAMGFVCKDWVEKAARRIGRERLGSLELARQIGRRQLR